MAQSPKIRSEQNTLGPLIVKFRDRPLHWRDLLFTFIPGCLAVLTPLLFGMWRGYYGFAKYGRTAGYLWSRPWINLSAVSLIPLLLLAFLRIRRAHRFISIHKRGVKLRLGRQVKQSIPWDQIQGLTTSVLERTFLGVPYKHQQHISLILKTGGTIRIKDQVNDIPELATRLKAKIFPRLLPELRSEYRSGIPIDFGLLTLNNQGLFFRGGRNPWTEVEHLSVKDGLVVLDTTNDHQKRLSIGDIPNLEILLQLIKEGERK